MAGRAWARSTVLRWGGRHIVGRGTVMRKKESSIHIQVLYEIHGRKLEDPRSFEENRPYRGKGVKNWVSSTPYCDFGYSMEWES